MNATAKKSTRPATAGSPDPVILNLLRDLARDPRDEAALRALADRLAAGPATEVKRTERLPRWASSAWRTRQPWEFDRLPVRGRTVYGLFGDHADHCGRTKVAGLEAVVTEPYHDVATITPAIVQAACRYGMVPAVSSSAAWNSGCSRGLLFDRQAVLDAAAAVAPIASATTSAEPALVRMSDVNPRPRTWSNTFEDAFTHAFYGTFPSWDWPLYRCPPTQAYLALMRLEPRLGHLLTVAAGWRQHRKPGWCGLAAWYGYGPHRGQGMKSFVERLVGCQREGGPHPELSTSRAYDVVYRYLYDQAMPGCRHKGSECVAGEW